MSKLGQKYNK